jgi:hypothetical protein
VLRQDSQRNGRKSSCPQYSYWQWRPIDSRSVSAIWVKDSSGLEGLRPLDTVTGGMVRLWVSVGDMALISRGNAI